MRSMTKSPVAVAREALATAQAALPAYSNKYSPRKYTQHQLFAILVLRQFFKTDYRGIVQYLHDLPDLRRVLGLKQVPFFTTLCTAERRLLKKRISLSCSSQYSTASAIAA